MRNGKDEKVKRRKSLLCILSNVIQNKKGENFDEMLTHLYYSDTIQMAPKSTLGLKWIQMAN